MGFEFLGKIGKNTVAQFQGKRIECEVIHIFQFDSDRKRMSIIVKDQWGYKMYIKGADNVILSVIHIFSV